jgi:NAD+ kinase
MKTALFANSSKPHAQETLDRAVAHLRRRGAEVCLQLNDAPEVLQKTDLRSLIDTVDCIISIGGDGSILHLVQHIGIPPCPLVGINLGSLGFLADIPSNNLEAGLDALCDAKYDISERTVIRTFPSGNITGFAINEVAVHRGDIPHLIDLAIRVDGKLVNTFSADGVIIATPGGSTAYSLAAGGPIIAPEVSCIVLTPICPHTISNRPIVLLPKNSISVELLHAHAPVDVAFDGQKPFFLPPAQPLELRICSQSFKLVSLYKSDFYTTVRSKLGWAGSLRSQQFPVKIFRAEFP